MDRVMETRMDTKRLLPVKAVASALGLGKTKAYELVACGRLPAVRIGSKILVRTEDLEAYIASLDYIRPTVRAS